MGVSCASDFPQEGCQQVPQLRWGKSLAQLTPIHQHEVSGSYRLRCNLQCCSRDFPQRSCGTCCHPCCCCCSCCSPWTAWPCSPLCLPPLCCWIPPWPGCPRQRCCCPPGTCRCCQSTR